MIHYHGGPITPLSVAIATWKRRHAMVSFERPDQVELAAEVTQSFCLDNGAFSVWKRSATFDLDGYAAFVREWERHPGYDFHIAPDVIEGDGPAGVEANELMLARWHERHRLLTLDGRCVPVWHLHEPLDRLARLCRTYPRVALGSSGQWSDPGAPDWWQRMGEAMDHICDADGRPPCKLHGLRMLNNTIFSQLPLSSADSCNVAMNHARTRKLYALTPDQGALVMVERIEEHASAPRWTRTYGTQANIDLFG